MKSDYWQDIPIGRENAISYTDLMDAWGKTKRDVRATLHDLSRQDNGDGYILIRSSGHKGFYRTDDREEIEAYRRETLNRARRTFAPFAKIDRVLGYDERQLTIEF